MGWEKYKNKIHAIQNVRKKFLQAETEEKILAEGNLPFKVKCQGIIIKIQLIVMKANFLQNALKRRSEVLKRESMPPTPLASFTYERH